MSSGPDDGTVQCPVASGLSLLGFRCTQCGNCCRDLVVPITGADLRRLVRATGHAPADLVDFLTPEQVDMTGEPQSFSLLDVGRRVMALRRHRHHHDDDTLSCQFLDANEGCSVYDARPRACRVFPFDASFGRRGGVRRLRLLPGTDCQHELNGRVSPRSLHHEHTALSRELSEYSQFLDTWNQTQRHRLRLRHALLSQDAFLTKLVQADGVTMAGNDA